ncbi:MAG: FG-GAP repeat protein [Elusimicrobia bacterium]|nr:FG-GAP repeat protein [Elusimicrobiota bacterium]
MTLKWDQADVVLTDDPRVTYGPLSASADFNGDGRRDLVFVIDNDALIVLGEPLAAQSALSPLVDWTIHFSTGFVLSSPTVLQTAHLNDDLYSDLIFGRAEGFSGRVEVIFGRPGEGGTIDLTQANSDLLVHNIFSIGGSLATGNFNGDGFQDLLIGSRNAAYILWGAKMLSQATYELTPIVGIPVFGDTNLMVLAGDINGNGKAEAIISQPRAGSESGVVYVVWGSSPFAPTPQELIFGNDYENLISPFLGNFDGDFKTDVGLWPMDYGYSGPEPWTGKASVLMGSWISTSTPVSNVPGDPGYVASVGLGIYNEPFVTGDFDGDGRTDLVGVEKNSPGKSPLRGILSSQHPEVWQQGDSFSSNFQVDLGGSGYLDTRLAMGDVNGDGLQDLLAARIMNSFYSPSQFLIFYGFVPLLNPSVQVAENRGGARINLTLSCDGDPSEMRLGGHIIDDFRDQWIPFKTKHAVTLTPEPGDKTVTAVFRNSLKRESESSETKVALAPGRTGVELISNRVRPDGRAVVECPMETAGRLRVTVWTSDGNRVMDLVDEERGPGVWTLEWDGRNAEGKRVAPGVYILQLDINGHVERTKILVQG